MRSKYSEKSACQSLNRCRSDCRTGSLLKLSAVSFFTFCVLLFSLPVNAQPSGGPYGPLQQTYNLPKVPGKIYYVAADGQPAESGETLSKATSLDAAIERVRTGDAIVMRGGTYRTGNLLFNQGITIQPYQDEQPVLKGTFVAGEWRNAGNGLWFTSWSHLFPAAPAAWWGRARWKDTPLYRFNNDMVFVDSRFLQAAGREGEVDENSYFIDYGAGLVYIGVDPANRLVEITAFDAALIRTTGECHGKISDRKGPVICGITFTQYARRAIEIEGTEPEGISAESAHGKEVTGAVFENCTISYCSRVAAFLRGDKLIMRHCRISDTSTEGIYLIASNDVLLEKNIFTRNNIENIQGYYPAAVKIFNQCHRVTCRDNLVIDLPNSNGIWYDVGNVDGVFVNNRVEGVGKIDREFNNNRPWPSDNGFFFEISKGAICAGNVFVNCDQGIFVLNSSNVQIYNNTLINSRVCIGRTERVSAGDVFGWHASSGPDLDKRDGHIFVNNLLCRAENYDRPLLMVWQPAVLCKQLNKPLVKQLDYNMYVRRVTSPDPLLLWSPAPNENCQQFFTSPQELQQSYPEFETHSRYFAGYTSQLFKCSELGNYELLKSFPGAAAATVIPAEISNVLGQTQKNLRYVGAYPPLP